MIDPNTKITLVGLDGGVKYVPYYMRDELLKIGWKVIQNPKQEYYPSFDTTLKNYQHNQEDAAEVEDEKMLEVRVI